MHSTAVICSSTQPFGKEHKEEGEEEEKQKQISPIRDMNIQPNHTHFSFKSEAVPEISDECGAAM